MVKKFSFLAEMKPENIKTVLGWVYESCGSSEFKIAHCSTEELHDYWTFFGIYICKQVEKASEKNKILILLKLLQMLVFEAQKQK